MTPAIRPSTSTGSPGEWFENREGHRGVARAALLLVALASR